MTDFSPSGVSCARVDDTFGPHAGSCRGGFDFTLLFEETILILLPLGLVVLALPLRGRFLLEKARKVSDASHLAILKLVSPLPSRVLGFESFRGLDVVCADWVGTTQSSWAMLAALQLAMLILWTSPTAVTTRTTVATSAVSLVSTLGIAVFSYIEHRHTVRPSTLLGLFLLCTLLFDIAHTRTLWLRALDWSGRILATVSTAAAAVKATVFVLEAISKRRFLQPEYRVCPPEATSGIFNRSFFIWLNPLFRSGFSQVLDIDHLFVLDKHLEAAYCRRLFLTAKGKCGLSLTSF